MNLFQHPVWIREVRATSRLARTPWLMWIATFVSAIVVVGAGAFVQIGTAERGAFMFQWLFGVAMLLATLLGPAISANAIALERDGKTWEPLVMADVSPRTLDAGKFWASYAHLCHYLLVFVPAAAVPVAFYGANLLETALAILMLFAWGALTVRLGLAMSAGIQSSRVALLLTVALSAAWGVAFTGLSFACARACSSDLNMSSVTRGTPIFWPVALAREPLTWINVRYLVIEVGAAFLCGWFALRELTVFSLTTAGLGRMEKRFADIHATFLALSPVVIVMLGWLPLSRWEIVSAEGLFAVYLFAALMVFAADVRSVSGEAVGLRAFGLANILPWWGLVAAGLAGPPLIALIAGADRERGELASIVVSIVTFTPFLAGLGAVLTRYITRVFLVRVLLILATIVACILPLMISAIGNYGREVETVGLGPLSPLRFTVTSMRDENWGALPWMALGLLALGWATVAARPRSQVAP